MSYSPVPVVATGDLWTASNHNTFIRDNFAAGVPALFLAKGDLAVASGVGAAARLPSGADGHVLTADSTQPLGLAWAEAASGLAVAARQGGDAANWLLPGSTNYTPARAILQVGVVSVAISGSSGQYNGQASVTFPLPFISSPLIFFGSNSVSSSGVWTSIHAYSITGAGFSVWVNQGANYTPRQVYWLAVGAVE